MSDPIITILASWTAVSHVAIVFFLALIVYRLYDTGFGQIILDWAREYALVLGLIVSATAFGGSMYLSNIAGMTPCLLCWYQRVAIFPLALLFLVALIRRDEHVFWYTLPLSVIGGLIAGYHYVIQMYPIAACSIDGGVDCTLRYVTHFGYVTISMMALTTCVLIIIVSVLLATKKQKDSSNASTTKQHTKKKVKK